jgi:hypothetical protein
MRGGINRCEFEGGRDHVPKLSLLLVVYLVTGFLVALSHNYLDNIKSQRQLISTLRLKPGASLGREWA